MVSRTRFSELARDLRMNVAGVLGIVTAMTIALIVSVALLGWLLENSASHQPRDHTEIPGQ